MVAVMLGLCRQLHVPVKVPDGHETFIVSRVVDSVDSVDSVVWLGVCLYGWCRRPHRGGWFRVVHRSRLELLHTALSTKANPFRQYYISKKYVEVHVSRFGTILR